MKETIPWLIVGASLAFFLVLWRVRRSDEEEPGLLKRIWRKIVAAFDFITNFG